MFKFSCGKHNVFLNMFACEEHQNVLAWAKCRPCQHFLRSRSIGQRPRQSGCEAVGISRSFRHGIRCNIRHGRRKKLDFLLSGAACFMTSGSCPCLGGLDDARNWQSMLLHLAGRALHTIRGGFAVHGRRSIPPAQLASQNGLIWGGAGGGRFYAGGRFGGGGRFFAGCRFF